MAVFNESDNRLVDLNPAYVAPQLPLSADFVESYLRNRTRPPFRAIPLAPYSSFDVIVHDHLPVPKSASEFFDHVSLFPSSLTQSRLSTDRLELSPGVDRLVKQITHNFKRKQNNFEPVALALYTLYSVSSLTPESAQLVVASLSPRADKLAAIDRVRGWARDIRSAPSNKALSDNGMTWTACADALCAALINELLGVTTLKRGPGRVELGAPDVALTDGKDVREVLMRVPEVTAVVARLALREHGDVEATVARLHDGWRPDVVVGKRGAGRRRRDAPKAVAQLDNFGDEVDVEWIKRRVAVTEAREQLEDEMNEQNSQDISENIVPVDVTDGVYNDEPDEGVLEGEISFARLLEDDESGGSSGEDVMSVHNTMLHHSKKGRRIDTSSRTSESHGSDFRRGRGNSDVFAATRRGGGTSQNSGRGTNQGSRGGPSQGSRGGSSQGSRGGSSQGSRGGSSQGSRGGSGQASGRGFSQASGRGSSQSSGRGSSQSSGRGTSQSSGRGRGIRGQGRGQGRGRGRGRGNSRGNGHDRRDGRQNRDNQAT